MQMPNFVRSTLDDGVNRELLKGVSKRNICVKCVESRTQGVCCTIWQLGGSSSVPNTPAGPGSANTFPQTKHAGHAWQLWYLVDLCKR